MDLQFASVGVLERLCVRVCVVGPQLGARAAWRFDSFQFLPRKEAGVPWTPGIPDGRFCSIFIGGARAMPPVLGFEEFYSGVYLPEHQDARCRGLHYVGMAAALAFAAARPATFLSSAAAVGAGLAVRQPL